MVLGTFQQRRGALDTTKLHQIQVLVESDCDLKTIVSMIKNIGEEHSIEGVVILSAQVLRSKDLIGVDVMTHSLAQIITSLGNTVDVINSNSDALNSMCDLFERQVSILETLTEATKILTEQITCLKKSE